MVQDNNYYSGNNDPYIDLMSGVLKNKLSVIDEAVLEKAEKDIAEASYIYFNNQNEFLIRKDGISSDLLKRIHFLLFREIYDWAGKYRTVRLTKGQSAPFCYPENIGNEVDKICIGLRQDLSSDIGRGEYLGRLAHYYNEMNAIHPFREGNGRTQRVFFQSVVKADGYVLDFSKVEFEEYTYNVIAAYNRVDHNYLVPIIDKCLLSI